MSIPVHAQATTARVKVDYQHDTLHLEVRDDGVGGAEATRGSGLTGLFDRIAAADGTLTVDSPAGGGTTLRATLRVHAAVNGSDG